ncbi:MAG: hypothetical protein EBQ67_06890 [Sphingobacteriia bacterium]|nr:hypothetical protein [Sphingobacteriia bacterium]
MLLPLEAFLGELLIDQFLFGLFHLLNRLLHGFASVTTLALLVHLLHNLFHFPANGFLLGNHLSEFLTPFAPLGFSTPFLLPRFGAFVFAHLLLHLIA